MLYSVVVLYSFIQVSERLHCGISFQNQLQESVNEICPSSPKIINCTIGSAATAVLANKLVSGSLWIIPLFGFSIYFMKVF